MKHGNAYFRGWLRLCVLLLGILSPVARAVTGSGTINVSYMSYSGSVAVAHIPYTWQFEGSAGPQRLEVHVGPGTLDTDPYGIRVRGYLVSIGAGSMLSTSNVSGGTLDGSWLGVASLPQTLRLEYAGPYGGAFSSLADIDMTGMPEPVTLTVNLTVKNNLNRAQTVSCTGTSGQSLGAWETKTMTFTVSGQPGTTVDLGSSPDALVLDSNYDPLLIPQGGGTASRQAHIGETPATKRVHAVFVNYSTSTVSMAATIDGGSVGHVDAGPSVDGTTPKTSSYDWNIELSAGSSLAFVAPSGHTATVQASQGSEMWSYVVVIDKGAEVANHSSTTTDSSSGTTTTTTTDPNTGTTTIDRSSPSIPSNAATNPGTVFNGGGTGGFGTGTSYTNTTGSAGNAASQDAANSLAGIAPDVKRLRENSDAQRSDYEGSISSDDKVQLKEFLSSNKNPTGKAQGYFDSVTSNAEAMRTKVASAVASKIGTARTDALDTPGEPNPGTVDLRISSSRTVKMQLNPFAVDAPLGGIVRSAAIFIKRLIAWALIAWFMRELMKEVRGVCGAAFLTGGYNSQVVDMVKSVNIFGWSVGVPASAALRVAMLALVVTLVLTLPVAVLAAAEAGLPWSDLTTVYHAGPPGAGGSASWGEAIGYADYVVPWRLLLSLPLYYILIHNVLFPLQMFWQLVFKFLP